MDLAIKTEDFRQKMFLEDYLMLPDKLGDSKSEIRRQARRLLAIAARYGMTVLARTIIECSMACRGPSK